jgi:hypothetical protein
MNKIVTTERSAASAVSMSHTGGGSYLQAESLGDVVQFAELMCQSKAGIPQYLHGNAADCMAVTMQALQWSFNPFSVAQKSYKIKDVIAYEAQLIAAVINTRADLKRRPQYEFRGEGTERQCIVTFEFNDGSVQVYESPRFDKITPKNSPLWKTDPDQQQAYYSIRAGARRYCPEVILGAYDREEVEEFRGPDNARDVTPPSVMDRLQAARTATDIPTDAQEGFSASHVQRETASVLTGEILTNTNTGEAPPSASPVDDETQSPPEVSSSEPSDIANASGGSPNSNAADDAPASAHEGSATPPTSPVQAEPSNLFEPTFNIPAAGELQHLKDFARKALDDAASKNDPPAKEASIERMRLNYLDVVESKDARQAIEAMGPAFDAVIKGKRTRAQAASYIAADLLGCAVVELEGRHG